MIDIDFEILEQKLKLISILYRNDFDEFWEWKVKIESRDGHILDDKHRRKAYLKLCGVLPKWDTYRGATGLQWEKILKESLDNIVSAYDSVRSYSLLDLNEIPQEPLRTIWDELGRVKDYGKRNPGGYYYVISVCKPLVFLWGQTLAFDSLNRENLPSRYSVPRDNMWHFKAWLEAMNKIQEDFRDSTGAINYFIRLARQKYGSDFVVPHGRFLDAYYWLPVQELKRRYAKKVSRKKSFQPTS